MSISTSVTIRIPESMLEDVDVYKSERAAKYAGSRSAAVVDLIALGLYEKSNNNHINRSFGRTTQNVIMLITMGLLFFTVVSMSSYARGILAWELFVIVLSTSFLFVMIIIAEELLVRVSQ